ncbi:MAG: hypothetical protein HY243_16435 [Proteobacteria bacterium]|nr:hypothetical protein [Pseudomonadota bacterium]
MKRLRKDSVALWVSVGFALALPAFALIFVNMRAFEIDVANLVAAVATVLSLLWFPTVIASLFFLRWRALWLLTSAPFALYYLYLLGMLGHALTAGCPQSCP